MSSNTKISTMYPPFQLGKSRFNQDTFFGRWRHFMDVIDPRTLFTSNAKLEESCTLLSSYKSGTVSTTVTDQQLWEAQKIKQAIIHPDTGEKVLMPFRMSGFVAFGSPLVVGLMIPNLTIPATVFWQWLNQSHNACVNFANRNASKPTPTSRFVLGYIGAVGSAVGIAVGLTFTISRTKKLSPAAKQLIQKFVPFPAVATASTCNVLLMRNSELSTGIEVMDKDNKVIGSSQIAAAQALKETAITRMFLPAPILVIPPIVMTMLEKTALLRRNPRLHLPFNALTTTIVFALALPVAIAIFPQWKKIKRHELEAELQELSDEEEFTFNKGL